jgi:hypothetical protein
MSRRETLKALAERVMRLEGYPTEEITTEVVAAFGVHQERINWGRRTTYRRWDRNWCAPFRPLNELDDLVPLLKLVGLQNLVAPICPRRATAAALLALAEQEEE